MALAVGSMLPATNAPVELGRKILNDANHPLIQQLETMDGAAAKAAELAAI